MKTLPTLPNLNAFIEEQFFFEAQQRGIEKLSQGQKLKAVYEDIQTSYPELTEQFFFEAQQRGIEKLSQGQKLKAVYEDIQTSYPELTELEVSKVMSNIIEYFGI